MKALSKMMSIARKEDILIAMDISKELAQLAGLAGNTIILLQLATEEACTNAWEYCSFKGIEHCEVRWVIREDDMEISVVQQAGEVNVTSPLPDFLGTRGRGLALIQGIMDEVTWISQDTNKALCMRISRRIAHD